MDIWGGGGGGRTVPGSGHSKCKGPEAACIGMFGDQPRRECVWSEGLRGVGEEAGELTREIRQGLGGHHQDLNFYSLEDGNH